MGRGLKTIGLGVLAAVGMAAVFALVTALPTMWLWNWLMPELFGLKEITFWQALGLLVLSTLLFRSVGGRRRSAA